MNEAKAGYAVSIVATDGSLVAGKAARGRSAQTPRITENGRTFTNPPVPPYLPNVSASDSMLYYLDGDADVRFLQPNGIFGFVRHINLARYQVAVFAVSPDDSRIAVSVLDYRRYPIGTHLYVEDLRSGAHHVDLLSSATFEEWPLGWHRGHLVIAVGYNEPPQDYFLERALYYNVIDSMSGKRLLSVCSDDRRPFLEPESPAGVECAADDTEPQTVVSWDGQTRTCMGPHGADCIEYGPLSPTGVIAFMFGTNGCAGSDGCVYLQGTDNVLSSYPVAAGQPIGWIDADHLVVDANFTDDGSKPVQLAIVDVRTLSAALIRVPGSLATPLPGGM